MTVIFTFFLTHVGHLSHHVLTPAVGPFTLAHMLAESVAHLPAESVAHFTGIRTWPRPA
jgi:hypothetical protein